jgi:hypothetical protein
MANTHPNHKYCDRISEQAIQKHPLHPERKVLCRGKTHKGDPCMSDITHIGCVHYDEDNDVYYGYCKSHYMGLFEVGWCDNISYCANREIIERKLDLTEMKKISLKKLISQVLKLNFDEGYHISPNNKKDAHRMTVGDSIIKDDDDEKYEEEEEETPEPEIIDLTKDDNENENKNSDEESEDEDDILSEDEEVDEEETPEPEIIDLTKDDNENENKNSDEESEDEDDILSEDEEVDEEEMVDFIDDTEQHSNESDESDKSDESEDESDDEIEEIEEEKKKKKGVFDNFYKSNRLHKSTNHGLHRLRNVIKRMEGQF